MPVVGRKTGLEGFLPESENLAGDVAEKEREEMLDEEDDGDRQGEAATAESAKQSETENLTSQGASTLTATHTPARDQDLTLLLAVVFASRWPLVRTKVGRVSHLDRGRSLPWSSRRPRNPRRARRPGDQGAPTPFASSARRLHLPRQPRPRFVLCRRRESPARSLQRGTRGRREREDDQGGGRGGCQGRACGLVCESRGLLSSSAHVGAAELTGS